MHEVEQRFYALLDAAVDAIVVIDKSGMVEIFNSAAERIFGYPSSEILGQHIGLLMPEPDRSKHDEYMNRYLETGEAHIIGIGREAVGIRNTGEEFPIDLAVNRFQSADEPKFIGIIRDISDRKAAQQTMEENREKLEHASRLSTIGELATGIAHEINQPLTAIISYAQACERMIASGKGIDDDLISALDNIGTQANRAADVISNLRGFAKYRSTNREWVDIESLISGLGPLMQLDAREHGVPVQIDISPGLPQINADPLQIQQVLLNLVRNAIDAMRDCADPGRGVVIRCENKRSAFLDIFVKDHGTGLTSDAIDHLFVPFFTTKEKGIGLGLAISHSIVAAHHGELQYERNPDGGSIFRVSIPVDIR